MLRPIRCSKKGLRIIPIRGTNNGSSAITSSYGVFDTTYNYVANAGTTVTIKTPFSRRGLAFASIGDDIQDGGCAVRNYSGTDSSGILSGRIDTYNAALNNADAGTIYGIYAAYDSKITDSYRKDQFDVHISRNAGRVVAGVITTGASPTTTVGKYDFVLSAGGTGTCTVTFNTPFATDDGVQVIATVEVAAEAACKIITPTKTGFVIKTFNAGNSLTDLKVSFMAFGSDTQAQTEGCRKILQGTQRKARMILAEIVNTAGTPSITTGLGSDEVTVTDTGTGDYRLTFVNAFNRRPVVIVLGEDNKATSIDTSATTTDIMLWDGAGAAADVSCNVLILGWDAEEGGVYRG